MLPPVGHDTGMDQIVSVAGAVLILAAYAAATLGWLDSRRPLAGMLNLVGSGLLAYVAVLDRRIGFIILELVWAGISFWGLARWVRNRGTR